MNLIWIRIFFMVVCGLVGIQLGGVYSLALGKNFAISGLGIGIAAALLIIIV